MDKLQTFFSWKTAICPKQMPMERIILTKSHREKQFRNIFFWKVKEIYLGLLGTCTFFFRIF